MCYMSTKKLIVLGDHGTSVNGGDNGGVHAIVNGGDNDGVHATVNGGDNGGVHAIVNGGDNDGVHATVNGGDNDGVHAIMSQIVLCIVFMWKSCIVVCLARWLQLALKSAIEDTSFESIDKILLNLYSLYCNSPKKLRELKRISWPLKKELWVWWQRLQTSSRMWYQVAYTNNRSTSQMSR